MKRNHVFAMAVLALWSAVVAAADVHVAAAANFTAAAKDIGTLFEKTTGHRAVFSFGSTGQLYTQISQGAPFEVFLSADQITAEKAVSEKLAVAGSRFTYATGKIVLYSRDATRVQDETTLKKASFAKLAIANPLTAPYGAAAVAAMRKLGVYDALAARVVQGNNIAQAYQFVETGNAELGFVALSQVAEHARGSRWIVPEALYPVIAQDAVLLQRGAGNPVAQAFLDFLRGPQAAAVKERFGYGRGD